MNLNLLNEKFKNCICGKEHICPVEYVEISDEALNSLKQLCEEYHNILLVCDNNTYSICGCDVSEILKEKITYQIVLKSDKAVVVPNEETIAEIEEKIDSSIELIIGVGSGVINDLCKYVSFKHNLSYFIVATAPSMDGYASAGSALILNGMKVTLNAAPPKAIIADTTVLKDAPMDMLRAGYGDIIGKYSCLNDWKLSALINDEYFCQKVYDLTYEMADKVRNLAGGIKERDKDAVHALMEALIIVGVAMAYVGNSRPASGSEHHMSHFFEITGILENKEYYPHGIDVIYSSAVTAKIRENIAGSCPMQYSFNRKQWISMIKRIYSTSADEVIALQDKLGWYHINEKDVISEKWDAIKATLKECPSFSQFVAMISDIGLSYDRFVDFYGVQKINDAILYAKDLKDRYTVLWLNSKYFNGRGLG